MSQNRTSWLPWLTFLVFLGTGALNRQVLFSTDVASPSLPSPSPQRDQIWEPCAGDPQNLLDQFLKRYDPATLDWFQVKIWQRMDLGTSVYEANTRLTLGPNHLARMEMDLQNKQGLTRLLLISDGKTLARATTFPGGSPTIFSQQLCSENAEARSRELANHGCCGGWTVVNRVRPLLHNLTILKLKNKEDALLKLTGDTISEASGLPLPPGVPVRCHLYLDKTTLWVSRMEWCRVGKGGEELLVEMEYREPRINQPLNEDECVRQFTFPNKI